MSGREDPHRRRDDGRHPRRADRRPSRLRPPHSGLALVRGRSRVSARLRDGLPDARDASAVAGRGVGPRSGASAAASPLPRSRSRRRSGAQVAVTSSSDEKLARARELGADLADQPRDRRRGGSRQGGDRRRRARDRRRRRRGDLEAHARGGTRRSADRRLRCDHRPESPGGAAPRLVEAALDPRLVDGHARRISRASSTWSWPERHSRSSTACSRSPTPARRTSAWRPASSSARSSFRFRPEPTSAPADGRGTRGSVGCSPRSTGRSQLRA